MSDRQEYNQCMRPYITGKKALEQRRLDFCIGAKMCSGKVSSKDEAKEICLAPKPASAVSARKSRNGAKSCQRQVEELASCTVQHIDMDQASNINSIEVALLNAMMECKCPQK